MSLVVRQYSGRCNGSLGSNVPQEALIGDGGEASKASFVTIVTPLP
jgi:hypothetical protein